MVKRGRCEFRVFDGHTCDLCDPVLEGVKRRVVMLGPWAGKGAPKFVCQDCLEEAGKAMAGSSGQSHWG
jgi:hypothetical protein